MSQETDVNNCFDSAFFEVVNQHPDPNKSISDDYSMPPQQVRRILFLTASCLSSKGYIFNFDQALINKISTETVLAALQDINNATKRKSRLPLVAASGPTPKAKAGPKKRRPGGR